MSAEVSQPTGPETVRLDADGLPDPQLPPTVAGVQTLVRWVVHQPLRVPLTPAELHRTYCTRSPRQVLAAGELGFTTPCHDLSALTAIALERLGLRPTLVLGAIKRPLSPWKFQCGLELELESATWVIGFGETSTYFYKGHFTQTRRRPKVIRARPPTDLDPDRTFLEWLIPGGRAELATAIPGYGLRVDLLTHAWRQTRLHYRRARARARDEKRAQRAGRLDEAVGRWRA